jgi:hypothetical protein
VVLPPLNLRPHRHMLSRVGTKHEVALLGRAPLFHLDPWWALGYFCRKWVEEGCTVVTGVFLVSDLVME